MAAAPHVRKPVSEKELLQAIVRDLEAADTSDRPFLRYYSLADLHNNPEVDDETLNLNRTSLSKLVNHLSWNRKIVVPETLGPDKTLLRVDIRKYNWTPATWRQIVAACPYGVHDREGQCSEIKTPSGVELPYVRVDWFVATASVAPLYHDILALPQTLPELKKPWAWTPLRLLMRTAISGLTAWQGKPFQAKSARARAFLSEDYSDLRQLGLRNQEPAELDLAELMYRLFRWIAPPLWQNTLVGHLLKLHRQEANLPLSWEKISVDGERQEASVWTQSMEERIATKQALQEALCQDGLLSRVQRGHPLETGQRCPDRRAWYDPEPDRPTLGSW